MKIVRRMLAALAIVAGVIMLIVWALALFTVRTIEDGTLVTNLATSALDNPAVEKLVVDKSQSAVHASLKDQGVNLKKLGLDGAVDDLVAAIVKSDTFSELVKSAVESAHEDLKRQLTEEGAAGTPLSINIDVSVLINESLANAPVIGSAIPDVAVQPVSVEVLDGNSFDRVRHVYTWVQRIARWAGWVGLALIVAGIVLTPNKRWFVPKMLFWLGGLSILAWFAVGTLDAERIAGFLPGGRDGSLGSAVAEYFPQATLDSVAAKTLVVGLVALAAAVALSLVIRAIGRSGKGSHRSADEPVHAQ